MPRKSSSVLQIRLELLGVQPLIWRRIQLDAACTFWDLHVAIQDAMGWTDSHLHLFQLADADGQERLIGLVTDDDELGIEPGWEHRVTDWLSVARPRTVYEYDFGDSWEHAVVPEDVLPGDGGRYPRCVAGARACPPEDVGGVHGYEEFLEAIADPDHEEHEGYLSWVGGAFDPARFDPKAVRFQDPKRRWRQVFGNAKGPAEGGRLAARAMPGVDQAVAEAGAAVAEMTPVIWAGEVREGRTRCVTVQGPGFGTQVAPHACRRRAHRAVRDGPVQTPRLPAPDRPGARRREG